MVNQDFPLLPDELTIYRAILRKSWIDPDTQEVDSGAFMLRLGIDEGLSTAFDAIAARKPFNKSFGVIEIQVKDIRDLGLDVIQDEPDHISIIGIPFDKQSINDYAGKLADKAKVVEKDF